MICLHLIHYTHGDHMHITNKWLASWLASVTKSAFGNHKYKT